MTSKDVEIEKDCTTYNTTTHIYIIEIHCYMTHLTVIQYNYTYIESLRHQLRILEYIYDYDIWYNTTTLLST